MERPHAACILLLVGGVVIVLWELLVFALATLLVNVELMPLLGPLAYVIWYSVVVHGAVMTAFGVLAIVSATLVWSGSLHRVRAGSVMGLVTGIVSIPFGAGLLIGSVLLIIGGVLGLTWKPTTPTTTAQPAQQL